jgi:inosine/xanthosine triphosphate pyrophosphatase family protein
VFVPLEGDGRTFAEMTDEEKRPLALRRAFRTLAQGVRVIQETEGR